MQEWAVRLETADDEGITLSRYVLGNEEDAKQVAVDWLYERPDAHHAAVYDATDDDNQEFMFIVEREA